MYVYYIRVYIQGNYFGINITKSSLLLKYMFCNLIQLYYGNGCQNIDDVNIHEQPIGISKRLDKVKGSCKNSGLKRMNKNKKENKQSPN